jgi:hypothetical protein
MKMTMQVDPRNVELMDAAMVPVLRRMTPEQRLASAHSMWRYARVRVETAVREDHPDWSDAQVSREILRRMLGSK